MQWLLQIYAKTKLAGSTEFIILMMLGKVSEIPTVLASYIVAYSYKILAIRLLYTYTVNLASIH